VINPLLSLEDEKDDMNYLRRSLTPVVHCRCFSRIARPAPPSSEMAYPFGEKLVQLGESQCVMLVER